MRAEIVAVGTELLLGQIVDTNSAWISEQLAAAGIDCHFQTRVGDNVVRIRQALEVALGRAEAVITCGGLGPTQDDLTREAIAEVMGVALRRDDEVLEAIRAIFARRGRTMTENNVRQADVPEGATVIPQRVGTAPGLICPAGPGDSQVIYAVPGVPHEMQEMVVRAVLPDLQQRAGEPAVIMSRTLRTWGLGESALAELVAPRLEALDAAPPGAPTIAFLASGIEGIKLRLTVKASDEASAVAALDGEEAQLRRLLGISLFSVDQPMEQVVGELVAGRGWRLAVAESFTGGLLSSRLVATPGASRWYLGGVVSYDSAVKRSLLGLGDGRVVTAAAARAMAEGVRRLLGADVALATTGVAGPDPQEGEPPGTVFVGIAGAGPETEAIGLRLPGDRERVRQLGVISALDFLRRRLLASSELPAWSVTAGGEGNPCPAR